MEIWQKTVSFRHDSIAGAQVTGHARILQRKPLHARAHKDGDTVDLLPAMPEQIYSRKTDKYN